MEVTKTDIENLERSLIKKIDELPKIIFDTEVEVQNGSKKKIRFHEAVTQNWERTARLEKGISEGTILVPIKNSDNKNVYWKISDAFTILMGKPSSIFNKTAKFSGNASQILRIIIEISVFIYAVITIIKSVTI